MAYAKLTYTASPAQTDFAINWPWLGHDDVVVHEDGVFFPSGPNYELVSSGTIMRLNTPAVGGEVYTIERETAVNPALPVFQNDTGFPADVLNHLVKRLSYAAEESAYNVDQLELNPIGRNVLLWDSAVERPSWGSAETGPVMGDPGIDASPYHKIVWELSGIRMSNGYGVALGRILLADGTAESGSITFSYTRQDHTSPTLSSYNFFGTFPLFLEDEDGPGAMGRHATIELFTGNANDADRHFTVKSMVTGARSGRNHVGIDGSGSVDGSVDFTQFATHFSLDGTNEVAAQAEWDLTNARVRAWGIT